jgi:RNA polymerase sigma factor (sigma-70 family)
MQLTDQRVSEARDGERGRLFAIAYGMLGSSVEAEDAVQEVFARWHEADRSAVRSPAAFLTTMVTRLAIDRLRSAERRRIEYVGPWLPEPLVSEFDPAAVVAEAEQLSLALLATLERLNPVERAVFLLRDVFDFDYSEIAEIVDKTEANCRQIGRRARTRVGGVFLLGTSPWIQPGGMPSSQVTRVSDVWAPSGASSIQRGPGPSDCRGRPRTRACRSRTT